jgi:hypothetical protein
MHSGLGATYLLPQTHCQSLLLIIASSQQLCHKSPFVAFDEGLNVLTAGCKSSSSDSSLIPVHPANAPASFSGVFSGTCIFGRFTRLSKAPYVWAKRVTWAGQRR